MLLQALSWSLFAVSIIMEVLFVISTFAMGFELFVGAAVVAGAFFLASEVLMIVSLHFYLPMTRTSPEAGKTSVGGPRGKGKSGREDEVKRVGGADAAVAPTARGVEVFPVETGTKARDIMGAVFGLCGGKRGEGRNGLSWESLPVNEDSIEQFRRLTVITVLSNMQYLPFLLPILPFLLSGLPLPRAAFHWLGVFCCLTAAVVINAYVKTTLAKPPSRLSSSHHTLLRALPSLVHALPGLCTALAWREGQGPSVVGDRGGFPSAFPAWLCLTAIYYVYLGLTFRGRPEVTGGRYLGEGLELWKGGWSLFTFLDGIDQYFQAKLVFMDAALDLKGKPHVFAFHPHGVQPFTVFWIQLSRAWREGVGRGQRFCVMTASVMHYVPLMRDILQWLGGREVSKESICHALHRQESVLLVPGGQQEMMESQSQMGEIRLVTRHVGFIRLALQTGTPLVPVLSFGEVEVMDFVRYPRLQRFFIQRLGIPVPFFPYGLFGFPIPRPVPVTVVFGRALEVEKIAEPTQEDVSRLAKRYFERIEDMFEKNKAGAEGHAASRLVLL
jgi:hypothetical protein